MEETPHIAILPSPGMGHLIPFLELAKKLVLSHNISVTCLVPTIDSPSKSQETVLKSLPHGISYEFLPAVSFQDLEDDVIIRAEIKVSLTISRSLGQIREALKSLTTKTRLVALIADLYCTDVFHLAEELAIPAYIFFMSNAMALSFLLHLPKLDETVSCEYRDLPEPVNLPGCIPVHGKDLMDSVRDRKNEAYKVFLHHVKRLPLAKGIIVNSCMELEPGAVRVLQDGGPIRPPVYPVGPLVRTGSRIRENDDSNSDSNSKCLNWLDGHPDGSVLYISFGSGGTLSYQQVNELALGLETTGQRFLWVVRTPNDGSSNASYLTDHHSQNNYYDYLPKGFLDRTSGQGLILPSWAPQIEILSHSSVGGFLTHCGWNSITESIMCGVPLIAWPLYSEQKMNAVMITEGMGIALRAEVSKSGVVERDEIVRVVKSLMGERGEEVKRRVKELKGDAEKALGDINGSSSKALSEFVFACKNKI